MSLKDESSSGLNASKDPKLSWLSGTGIIFQENDVIMNAYSHQIEHFLNKWEKKASDEEKEEALHSLDSYFRNASILEKWLQTPENKNHSFVQILTRVHLFQTHVFEMISEFLTLTSFDKVSDNFKCLVQRIIQALSNQPQIFEPNQIANIVLDTISSVNESIQPILISSLPAIIEHIPSAVSKMIDMMIEKPKMIQDTLTALEGFQLTPEETKTVRAKVLNDILGSASTNDLNRVVMFLIRTTDDKNASETVEAFRESLVVVDNREGDFSTNDINKFLIIQLKSGLQVCSSFTDAYYKTLCKSLNLVTLDYWIIYCMFSIPSQKKNAQKLINTLSDTQMNSEGVKKSIVGHIGALETILNNLTDLISWCLDSNSENISDIGASLASTLFEEVSEISTQQNIIGSLLIHIGIGNESNKYKAAKILSSLNEKKLSVHLPLISGIMSIYDSIPLNVFQIIINLIVKLEFVNGNEDASQIHIFVSKMLQSTKEEAKNVGVVSAAAIINRVAHFDNFESMQHNFHQVISSIGDNPFILNLFFEEIYLNQNRNATFNEFLIEELTKQFITLICENEFDQSYWYCLDENAQSAINIISSAKEQTQKKTLSLQKHRQAVYGRNTPIIFSHSGLKLLLDAHCKMNHDIEQSFGEYFTLPFHMFDPQNSGFKDHQKILAILLAHSYILETLNYFGEIKSKVCWKRIQNRIELENKLFEYISNAKSFNFPYFGDMFPKSNSVIKKANNQIDPSAFFVLHYRGFFNPPRIQYLNLLFEINLPLNNESSRVCIRLLDDYLYLLKPDKNAMFPCKNFNSKDNYVPPLDLIEFISKRLLESLLYESNNENLSIKTRDVIINKIILIINNQIILPIYKDKASFQEIMKKISGSHKPEGAFEYYMERLNENMDLETQANLIVLLNNLLHGGNSSRVFDVCGKEAKYLAKACKSMLQHRLSKAQLKKIFPIFLAHNSSGYKDIDSIVKNAISSNENSKWQSFTHETTDIYFQQCIIFLNSKIGEIEKNVNSKSFNTINDDVVVQILKSLNQIGSITLNLLKSVIRDSIPTKICQKILTFFPKWIKSCTNLLGFLKDANRDDPKGTFNFIKSVQSARHTLQTITTHVRKDNPKLQRYLPKFNQSLSSWSYNLKASGISDTHSLKKMKTKDFNE